MKTWGSLPGRLLVAIALAAAAGCGRPLPGTSIGPTPIGMSIDAQDLEYRITGGTARELRAAMNSAGPVVDGRRWDGATRWHVRWRFRYAARGTSCRMDSVNVMFESRVTLPRWEPPAGVSPELVAQWHGFVDALRLHEYGHRNIGADAGRAILRELRNLHTIDCSQMSAMANSTARRILDRYRVRERRFDEETGHGRRSGVVWPPQTN